MEKHASAVSRGENKPPTMAWLWMFMVRILSSGHLPYEAGRLRRTRRHAQAVLFAIESAERGVAVNLLRLAERKLPGLGDARPCGTRQGTRTSNGLSAAIGTTSCWQRQRRSGCADELSAAGQLVGALLAAAARTTAR